MARASQRRGRSRSSYLSDLYRVQVCRCRKTRVAHAKFSPSSTLSEKSQSSLHRHRFGDRSLRQDPRFQKHHQGTDCFSFNLSEPSFNKWTTHVTKKYNARSKCTRITSNRSKENSEILLNITILASRQKLSIPKKINKASINEQNYRYSFLSFPFYLLKVNLSLLWK